MWVNEALSYLFLYYSVYMAAAVLGLVLRQTLIRQWGRATEGLLIIGLQLVAAGLTLLYDFQLLLMGLNWGLNLVILIILWRWFASHSLSGVNFYVANLYMVGAGIAWGIPFLLGLPVSLMTKLLLMATAPLVVLVIPASFVLLIELYEVLCREKWKRPRNIHPRRKKLEEPMVSIHVPTYSEPPDVVKGTLDKLAELDYSNYEVLVIDNNTTDPNLWEPVRDHCQELGDKFKFLHVENLEGAKAGALNYLMPLTHPQAEIIGVVDADYHVDTDFLRALVGYFDDENVGFVQTPHDYREWRGNIFQSMCYWEYKIFFYTTMVSLNEREAAITVGTMCLIRKQALIDAGGWSEWCVTEDSELAIRIHDKGYSSVYVNTTFGKGLIPDTFEAYKKQRYRWTAGPVQEFRHHLKHLIGLSGRSSKYSLTQRLHHLHHGLNNVLIGLGVPFLGLNMAVIGSMVWHREVVSVPFELWLAATVLLGTNIMLTIFTDWVVMKPGFFGLVGKNLASRALYHVIVLAAFKTTLTGNAAWKRTNKFKSRHSVLAALYATKDEMVLAGLLMGFIYISYSMLPYTGLALMFMIGLSYSALSYMTAPLVSLMAVWSGKRSAEKSSVVAKEAIRGDVLIQTMPQEFI